MFVRMWMTADVKTVSPETPILDARALMKQHNIRRLPVMRDGRLVGLVTQGDIQEAGPSDATSLSIWEINYLMGRITVGEIMTKTEELITVSPDDPIEHAALLMRQHKVGGLPVLEGDTLVGIITESDIFDILLELLGVGRGGSRVTLELEDRPGALAEAFQIIKEHEINVRSVVTCDACRTTPDRGVVVARLDAYDWRPVVKALKDRGIRVLDARAEEARAS